MATGKCLYHHLCSLQYNCDPFSAFSSWRVDKLTRLVVGVIFHLFTFSPLKGAAIFSPFHLFTFSPFYLSQLASWQVNGLTRLVRSHLFTFSPFHLSQLASWQVHGLTRLVRSHLFTFSLFHPFTFKGLSHPFTFTILSSFMLNKENSVLPNNSSFFLMPHHSFTLINNWAFISQRPLDRQL